MAEHKKEITSSANCWRSKRRERDFGLPSAESGGWWNMLLCGPWGPHWLQPMTHAHTGTCAPTAKSNKPDRGKAFEKRKKKSPHYCIYSSSIQHVMKRWWSCERRMDNIGGPVQWGRRGKESCRGIATRLPYGVTLSSSVTTQLRLLLSFFLSSPHIIP